MSIIVRGKDGVPWLEKITGDTVDILEYLDFAFWDLVWFGDDPEDGPVLGGLLSMSHRAGSILCYHVLKSNGSVESRTMVQHFTQDNFALSGTAERIWLFDIALVERLKDDSFSIAEGEALIYEDEDLEEYENDNINFLEPSKRNMSHDVERNDYNDDAYNALLSAELMLPNNDADGYVCGTVTKRA